MDEEANASVTCYKVSFRHETDFTESVIREFHDLKRHTFFYFRGRLFGMLSNILKSESPEKKNKPAEFTILWKDKDNDSITISSNEEYLIALKEMHEVKLFNVQIFNRNELNLPIKMEFVTEEANINYEVKITKNKPATFKVSVMDDKFSVIENRKFTIEKEGYDFMYFKFKLELISNVLKYKSYAVSRKDRGGKLIAITSEEELTDAINEMPDERKHFFAITDSKSENSIFNLLLKHPRQIEEIVHLNQACRACRRDNFITGFMYKCIECKTLSYTLCSSCESNDLHLVHHMLRWGGTRQWNGVYFPSPYNYITPNPTTIVVHLTGDDFEPTSQSLSINDVAPGYRFCNEPEEKSNTAGCQSPAVKRLKKKIRNPMINYNLLVKNLKKFFPVVKNKTLVMSYYNRKGENAILRDNDTTTLAFMEMDRCMVHVLFVVPDDCENRNFGLPETNKNCRDCVEKPRFKCLECFNFQMCTECSRKGSHSEATCMNHVMTRLSVENYPDDIPDFEPESKIRVWQDEARFNKYEVQAWIESKEIYSDPDEIPAEPAPNKKKRYSERQKEINKSI